MSARDMCDDVAAVLHPMPARPGPDSGPGAEDVYSDMCQDAAREREDAAESMRLSWDEGDIDPVLAMLAAARQRMLAAERDVRLLVAYGREFVRPRPYRLEDLAQAAGMSISGVRTAYDDDEVDQVAELTGQRQRRRPGEMT